MFNIIDNYATLVAFAWMFVEGLYLNTLISSAVFGRPNFIRYYIIAWGKPILITLLLSGSHGSLVIVNKGSAKSVWLKNKTTWRVTWSVTKWVVLGVRLGRIRQGDVVL